VSFGKEFDQHCELWEKEKKHQNIFNCLCILKPHHHPPPKLNIFDGI